MAVLVKFARFFVGIIFIFSGLVKLNDPLGFAYKLEEYFSPGVLDIPFLMPYALLLAVFLVIVEVLLGLALIIGYAKKVTLWSLLLMIIFFTFLTFYSAYFNKVTDCGCFGDAIPLTPWQSFYKDVLLSFFIIILVLQQQRVAPLFNKSSLKWVIFATSILCFYLAYFVLMHLPIIDFRAYSVGTNIAKARQLPEDAPPAITNYHWTFNQNGEEKIITTRGRYPSVNGKLINVETEIIREAPTPPIHDFNLILNGEDQTEAILDIEKLLIVSAYNLDKTEHQGWQTITEAISKAKKQGYKVIGLSASGQPSVKSITSKYKLDIDFYSCDETAIKTIVRSNPGLVKIHLGVIKQKLHWNDAEDLKLD